MQPSFHISEPARDYLIELLSSQGVDAARIFVVEAGTPRAETCLAYCRPGEESETDLEVYEGDLKLYLDKRSLPYLKGLEIGLQDKGEQKQITIRAPNAKKPQSAQGREVEFERECPAKLVPSGDDLMIPKGAEAAITQALGASYTLLYHGNLIRIDGKDADAIGLTSNALEFEAREDGRIDEDQVWKALSMVYDPEIPVNIVSLGLVYKMDVDQSRGHVFVEMTLTAPGCGMGDVLVDDIKRRLAEVPHVQSSDVQLVFDPPWTREMMSEEAQLETGMFF
ncbi:putative FeS assembly SUF system protein SufT [Marinimicrobium koreense]|uniref:Putative FeS assembly SUF system protein SufT n=1 Tax=Marinimicrobium koreense TaxID=306545 RepID=A0A3N1P3E3_9GAMM|nr:putative FeS assembly SUF system protein SufT [Marinimicrobium koreense]